MSPILDKLIVLANYKEQIAQKYLAEKKQELLQLSQMENKQKKKLKMYRSWRIQKEPTLFSALKRHPVNVTELIRYNEKKCALKEKQVQMEKQLHEIQVKIPETAAELKTAESAYAKACKKTMKLTEYRSSMKIDAKARAERLAEKEIDAFNDTRQFTRQVPDEEIWIC